MSGFIIRRLILQNITAVALYCPIPAVSCAALVVSTGASFGGADASAVSTFLQRCLVSASRDGANGRGSFSLVTDEEMRWIRQQREQEASESRVVLSTRPSCSLIRGIGGGAVNVLLGCLLSPLVFLSATLERVRMCRGPVGLLTAGAYGAAWGGVFFAISIYAAGQQVALSFYYKCVASPMYYCRSRRPPGVAKQWSVLSCKFESPCGVAGEEHPLLAYYPADAVLRERAMRRLAVSQRSERKKTGMYTGKKGGSTPGEEDYYALLGVEKGATDKEIKEAFNRLVLRLHPDKNPSPNAAMQFDSVTKAYRVLSNPTKRKKYDVAGSKGVEDLGEKKREAVRAVFGGGELHKLSGDVFMGSFSQRVIDGLDFVAEDLAVVKQRMYERCRDELLNGYLAQCNPDANASTPSKGSSSSKPTSNHKREDVRSGAGGAGQGPWGGAMAVKLRKLVSTGLGKEVLFVIGSEYHRAVEYYDLEWRSSKSESSADVALREGDRQPRSVLLLGALRAKEYITKVAPHRFSQSRSKVMYLSSVRSNTFKNSEAMVDLAWYTSVQELELTARHVALAVLYDRTITAEEAQRRRDALEALSVLFLGYGQPYKGANKATMDQLTNSIRDYQQQQQREKDSK